jgi:hypothetical protein
VFIGLRSLQNSQNSSPPPPKVKSRHYYQKERRKYRRGFEEIATIVTAYKKK